MDIKKIILPALLVVIFAAYVVYDRVIKNDQPPAPVINNNNQDGQPSPTVSQARGPYNDGQYTGDSVDAFFGPMQVKATISNGNITDIEFLQHPNQQGYTTQLNAQVMPVLTSEAIKNQVAKVDIVSGATQSSQGFMKSLASALRQAGTVEQINVEVQAPAKK